MSRKLLLIVMLITLAACSAPAPTATDVPIGPTARTPVTFGPDTAIPPTDTPTTVPTSAPLPKVENLPAPITTGSISDNLPVYTCAADAFASYSPLQAIQHSGLDGKH